MSATVRIFQARPAVRAQVPLQIGLMGPPGGGKTMSALRLASGIAQDRGGDIVVIDTEGGRALKYADAYKFKHVLFDPPYRPSDFLAAIKQQLPTKPAAIIVDSTSDEHEGEGGVLDWHDRELDRMAGDDWGKRERMTQAAWIRPKRDRIAMMNGLNRIMVPLIFCFRAREKTRQIKNEKGRMEPVNIGWQPIAPSEIVHSLDLTCILPPRAEGVPVWKSDKAGEDFIIKLPEYLKPYIREGQAMSEDMGCAFSKWSRGDVSAAALTAAKPSPADDMSEEPDGEDFTDKVSRIDTELAAAAEKGWHALKALWDPLPDEIKDTLRTALTTRHKPRATEVSRAAKEKTS